MATLQKIRTRAGLLVAIVIGLSLAAFILGDMFQSGGSVFQKGQMEIGEVDGESIEYPQFQRKVEQVGEFYKMNSQRNQLDEDTWVQIREQTWQTMVRDIVMEDVYKDLGIAVSSDELFDMLQGANLHPIVQQIFRDPNTGQVNRGSIVNFLKNLEIGVPQEQRNYWYYLEDQIVEDRTQSKYSSLVGKGLYITNEEAQNTLNSRNKRINFDYVALNVSSVADSQVVVVEEDLKKYFDAHKEDYKQEKQRKIEYIVFDVKPSNQDFQDAEVWINDIKPDFESATDDVQFVNSNSDVSFEDIWQKQADLPENIGNWIYEEDAELGEVFGPYFEDDAYKLAKLHASEMMPDSVKARHILLQVNTQAELSQKQALADSLKGAIEGGSNFAELAQQFSMDQGSAVSGGDLGWFGRGQMVKPFEEAAFNNKVNEVTIVTSQFGIHIVQTTARGSLTRQVQVAYLIRNVVPSTKTYQDVYAKASKFAGENTNKEEFDEAVVNQQLNKRVGIVRENDRTVPGLENSRALIRTAFETKEGELLQDHQGSTIFDLGDNFVIATLASVTEEGIASFEEVKPRVELAVTKEKKIELLKEKAAESLDGKTSLEAVASELNKSVKSASNVTFSTVQIPGLGMEPKLIGAVSQFDVDQISNPVAGNNAVYIVMVTSIDEMSTGDVQSEKARLAQNLNSRVMMQAYEAQRSAVEIDDKRSKFY